MATFKEKSTWLAKHLDAEEVKNASGSTEYVYFERGHTDKWYVYDQKAVIIAWDLKHSKDDYERERWYSFWCTCAGWEASDAELERYGLPLNG